MQFINVTADQCQPDGTAISSPAAMNVRDIKLKMNVDLIAFIKDKKVHLKGNGIIHADGHHYNNVRIADSVKLDTL